MRQEGGPCLVVNDDDENLTPLYVPLCFRVRRRRQYAIAYIKPSDILSLSLAASLIGVVGCGLVGGASLVLCLVDLRT